MDDQPNIDRSEFELIDCAKLGAKRNPPKFLFLYGSLRTLSYSRCAAEEAARILTAYGAECELFDPRYLPLVDSEDDSHPKVGELREAAMRCDGMVWSSPERQWQIPGIK